MAYVLPTSGSQGQRKPRSEEDAAFGGAPALTTANTLAPASAPAQQTTFASAKRVADANLGADQSASTDRLLTPAKQEAAGMNTNLDLQGTNYTKTAQAAADKQYKDQDWMGIADKAVSGFGADQADAYGKAKQTVQGRDLPVTAFKAAPMQGLESGANLALGNVAGTLKQNAGSNYSSGMSNLDASLMKRTGGIQNLQGQVGTLQEGVNSRKAHLESTLGKDAQGYLDTQKAGASQAIQDILKNMNTGITSGAQQRFTAGQAADQSRIQAEKNTAGERGRLLRDMGMGRVAQGMGWQGNTDLPETVATREALANLDYGSYVKTNGDQRQLSDFYTDEDVQRYGNASSLLGNSDTLTRTNNQQSASLDEQGLNTFIEEQLAKAQAASNAQRKGFQSQTVPGFGGSFADPEKPAISYSRQPDPQVAAGVQNAIGAFSQPISIPKQNAIQAEQMAAEEEVPWWVQSANPSW